MDDEAGPSSEPTRHEHGHSLPKPTPSTALPLARVGRIKMAKTLAAGLNGCVGLKVTVELQDDTIIDGILAHVSVFMMSVTTVSVVYRWMINSI